nr:hypothetical protein [Tanacetum cinerariifolium]
RERERAEGEVKLLDSTVGRVVLLLPVAPARTKSELEDSVNKLFDEGGSANQGNSATGDTAAVTAERPKRHPSNEVATGDKSPSVLKELLTSSLLNVEAGAKAMTTLPFETSYVSATPKREDDSPTDSVTGANFRAIVHAERFVISPDSSHHSSTHAFGAEVASVIRYVVPLPVDSEHLHEVFIPRWNISNDALLDDLDTFREFVDHLAPSVLFLHIRDMNYEQLFTEFNVGTAQLQSLVTTKDLELKYLKASLSSLRSQNDRLVDHVHALEATCFGLHEQLSGYENLTDRLEEFQDTQLKVVNDKVAKLDANFVEMAFHLEEKFYPCLLTTISGQRWLLTHGLKLVLVKCLNSSKYLTALG